MNFSTLVQKGGAKFSCVLHIISKVRVGRWMQDYPSDKLGVVLVDDGSHAADALEFLDSLESEVSCRCCPLEALSLPTPGVITASYGPSRAPLMRRPRCMGFFGSDEWLL